MADEDEKNSEVAGEDEQTLLQTILSVATRTAFGTKTLNTLAPPPIFIQGLFRDPVTETLRALPPHTWTLSSDKGDVRFSAPTDSEGITTLLLDLAADTSSEWELSWEPELVSGSLSDSKEVWIDLDKLEHGALTKAAWVTKIEALEKRRLVRLVAWTSSFKAERGGFLEGVANMNTNGKILATQFPKMLRAWGSREKPLHVAVDHDWMWTYIEFVHYDMISGATEVLSPGLVVWAKDKNGKIVGGGASISSGADSSMSPGLVYVLQQRVDAEADDTDFMFETPKSTVLDMDEAKPLDRLRIGKADETDIRRFRPIPEKWHTFGMDAFLVDLATHDPIHEGRHEWRHEPIKNEVDDLEPPFSIRTFPTFVAGARLRFNLDDTVLVSEQRVAIPFPAKENFVSALDHLMRVQAANPRMLHVSDEPLAKDQNYLAAETFIYDEAHDTRPELSEKVVYFTRAIENEGVFYDLRREHVTGKEGQTRALGARAAVANDHKRVDHSVAGLTIPHSTSFRNTGRYWLHLFDTPIDAWGYRGVGMHLHHLVVHCSVFVDVGDTGSVDAAIAGLEHAAMTWNPGHPAGDPDLAGKSYAMVPEVAKDEELPEGGPIVLVRHFFSHRRKESPGPFRILLHHQYDASENFDPGNRTMNLKKSDLASLGDSMADADGSKAFAVVMAHEFGHAVSLPDEYAEPVDRRSNKGIPKFDQPVGDGGPARPFNLDGRSKMKANLLPRLRHFFPHWYELNNNAALQSAFKAKVSFVLEHTDFPGTSSSKPTPLRYILPAVPGDDAATRDPWDPIKRKMLSEKVELLLYRLGPDESTYGSIIAGSGTVTLKEPLDGILLVRTNYAMRAPKQAAEQAAKKAKEAALGLLSAIQRGEDGAMTQTPILKMPEGSPLRTIALIYQPFFALNAATPTPHVNVELGDQSLSVVWSPGDLKKTTIKLRSSECGFCLIRFALGILPLPWENDIYVEPLNGPLTLEDLVNTEIASTVGSMLGSKGGWTWLAAPS